MKDISIKNKSISKCKEINQQKYNVDYNLQREDIRKQIIQTVKNKTGYDYAFLNKEKVYYIINMVLIQIMYFNQILLKINQIKQKN